MKKSELAKHSVYLCIEYYKNNIQPFLNAFSKNCIWIGPCQGQIIQTKEALLQAFAREDNLLTFEVENIQIIPVPVNHTSMNVLLTYTVISHYPHGEVIICQQRLDLLWVEETEKDSDGNIKKDYFIRSCHISNEIPSDTSDMIYPNHFTNLESARLYNLRPNAAKLVLKGLHNSYFYLFDYTILWVESKANHTLIHTINTVYESIESLAVIADKYQDFLCRVHSSYAVNPMHVSSIGRFYVEMDDGKRISIPEKKYTKTRDEINKRIEKAQPHR